MKTRKTCRVCDGALVPILSLGEQFVSNFLLPDEPEGTKAPLELVLCRRCSLVQLKHTVPPFALYQNYWYRSGTNRTMRCSACGYHLQVRTVDAPHGRRQRLGHRMQ